MHNHRRKLSKMKVTYLNGVTRTFIGEGEEGINEVTNWYFDDHSNTLAVCGANGLENYVLDMDRFVGEEACQLRGEVAPCPGCIRLPANGSRSIIRSSCSLSKKIVKMQDDAKVEDPFVQKRTFAGKFFIFTPIFVVQKTFKIVYETYDTSFHVTYWVRKPRLVTHHEIYQKLDNFLAKRPFYRTKDPIWETSFTIAETGTITIQLEGRS
jgi:hypothetical protein